jgi:hypothetical protein
MLLLEENGQLWNIFAAAKDHRNDWAFSPYYLPENASISLSYHGPMPLFPTYTAINLPLLICSSNAFCQEKPGRSSHSSSQGKSPYAFSCSPIRL